MAFTPEQRATAVGRVLAGESRRAVAKDMGIADSTVRSWVKASETRETAGAQELAQRAQVIAEEIEHLQEAARHALIRRIVELAPRSDDLDKVANAYAKVTDKSLLTRGKPNQRTETISKDSIDGEIAGLLEEMARREQSGAATNGSS